MDGTLYDEYDFIAQVYKPIADQLASVCDDTSHNIYTWMIARWLEMGSSYRYLFSEVLQNYRVKEARREFIIRELLDTFRHFEPELTLTKRVQFLLNYFKSHFELFLVTDGGITLQAAKFNSLGLDQWFTSSNVWISGTSGPHYQKPSRKIAEKIQALTPPVHPRQVVFFGDREVDRAFALNLNYHFVQTHCLQAAESSP